MSTAEQGNQQFATHRFTEGFDTADFKDAKTLIEELTK
jgi:hypothetical protein